MALLVPEDRDGEPASVNYYQLSTYIFWRREVGTETRSQDQRGDTGL
jgi:hypothetical protein